MTILALKYDVALVWVECCNCSCPIALTESHHKRLKEQGGTFYCPHGHAQHFTEPEVKKLRKQLEHERKLREWAAEGERHAEQRAKREENRARAYRGHATRLKKRIAEGKCPCCHERFADLQEHIRAAHPGYGDES